MGPLLWAGNWVVWYVRAAFLVGLAVAFGIEASWLIAPFLLVAAAGYALVARAKQRHARGADG